MEDFLQTAVFAQKGLWFLSLAMARLVPVFQIAPFLGGRHLSGMVRNSLAMALGLFLVPVLASQAPAEGLTMARMAPLLAKEAMLGVLFALVSSFAFYAASGIGFIVDNQRGLSMAQSEDPISGEQTSPLGGMAIQTLIMIFIAGGGLALFFQGLLTTYVFWPPFSFWPRWDAEPIRAFLFSHFSWYLTTLVTMALPMLLVCFLVDFGMGMMNRFAPQLNVFFLAMPVKSGFVMALLTVYWASMFVVLRGEVLRLPILWDALRHAMRLE